MSSRVSTRKLEFPITLVQRSALLKCYVVVGDRRYIAKRSHEDALEEFEDVCKMCMSPNTRILSQC